MFCIHMYFIKKGSGLCSCMELCNVEWMGHRYLNYQKFDFQAVTQLLLGMGWWNFSQTGQMQEVCSDQVLSFYIAKFLSCLLLHSQKYCFVAICLLKCGLEMLFTLEFKITFQLYILCCFQYFEELSIESFKDALNSAISGYHAMLWCALFFSKLFVPEHSYLPCRCRYIHLSEIFLVKISTWHSQFLL